MRADLLNHIRTHSGEKPIECDTCLMSFACYSNVNQHNKELTLYTKNSNVDTVGAVSTRYHAFKNMRSVTVNGNISVIQTQLSNLVQCRSKS